MQEANGVRFNALLSVSPARAPQRLRALHRAAVLRPRHDAPDTFPTKPNPRFSESVMAGGTRRKGRAYHANVLIERARRLSEEWERERLLRTSINDDEICVICREKGDTQQIGTSGVRNVMVTLPCGHRFHDFCLEKQVLVSQYSRDAKKCAVCRQECVDFFDKLFPMCSEKHHDRLVAVVKSPPLRLVALQHFVFTVQPQWKRIVSWGTRLEMTIEFTCLSPGLKMLKGCSSYDREKTVNLHLRRESVADVEYTCADVAVTFCTYIDFDGHHYDDNDAYRRMQLVVKRVTFRFSGSWRQFRVQVVHVNAGSCLDNIGRGIVCAYHEDSSRTAPAVTFEQPKEFTDEGRGISV